MQITKTRLKQIIQEELAAVKEAAGDGSGTGVSKEQRDKDRLKAARVCNSKKGKQWDPTELTGPGLFSAKLERACKDKVKENVNSQEPRYVDMDEVGEILKAKFESDAWDLRHNGDPRPEEVAAKLLLDYVTGHINRLEKGHLEESELEEGAGEVYCKDRRAPGGFRRQPPCPPGYDQQQIADKRGPAGGVEQSDRYRSGHKPSIWE